MEDNDWYKSIVKETNLLRGKMPEGEYNDYGLDLLLRIAKRVEDFSPQCEECSSEKEQISNILAGISNWPSITKEQKKNYIQTLRIISDHLKNQHNLTQKGWPLWISIIIGGLLGALPGLISALLESDPESQAWSLLSAMLGFPIGVVIGLIAGLIINKVRRETIDLSK